MSVQVKGSGTIGGLDEGLNVVGVVTSTSFVGTGVSVVGVVTATSFVGSGANLTSLPAANITGTLPAISGANLTSLPAQATIANNADNRVITGGSGVNLNGEANLTFDDSHLILGYGKGIRTNFIRPANNSNTNTGGAAQQYWKLGEISLNGSEGAEITLLGANGYSSGNAEVYGKTTIVLRGSNGNTLLGSWWVDGGQGAHYADVRWKYISGTNYELWVSAGNFNNIAPFVRATGTFDTTNAAGTGSNTAPSGSTALPQTHYKTVGSINTIQYTNTHTRYLRNIKMDNGYGIDFSATANSSGSMSNELLDDYEEGTFTPQLNGMGSVSYDLRAGRYTKIGNVCYFQIRINLGSRSGGSHAHITNMPFTADHSTIQYPHCTFFAIEDVDLGGDRHPVAQFQSSEIYLYSVGYESSANYSNIDENQIKDSSQWGLYGFYYTT